MEVAEEMNAACQGIQYKFTSIPPHLNGNAPQPLVVVVVGGISQFVVVLWVILPTAICVCTGTAPLGVVGTRNMNGTCSVHPYYRTI